MRVRHLTVYRRLFYDSDCYKNGVKQKPAGVQVHSTGAVNSYLKRYVQPDDGRLGKNQYGNSHNRPGGNVCASAYIGKLQDGTVAVYQALPFDQRCWLSGSGPNGNANRKGYLGFEVCEDNLTDEKYFLDAVMEKAVLLTAYWCQEYGIDPDAAVRDHHELHSMGLASNHADITKWLRKFGRTMNDYRAAVKAALAEGIQVTYIDCDEVKGMYEAKATNPGSYLNLRKGKATTYAVVARIPQGATVTVLNDADPAWWQVAYKGSQGYAMAEYLTPIDKPAEPAPAQPAEPAPEQPSVSQDEALAALLENLQATLETARGAFLAVLDAIEKLQEGMKK